ncbi:hypothetical protein QBC43DRAFT_337507 [Cladorrhinum sp. PSN259]|nr:hypothetical protein QBC43DRAFT_337507 [Cladorrhinum sp. PSN259]
MSLHTDIPVPSLYGEYKHATEIVETWLNRTATNIYLYGAATGAYVPPSNKRRFLLQIGDFVPMARIVVQSDPSVVLPGGGTFLAALKRAIQGRKALFELKNSRKEVDSRHDHFIAVLEQVGRILKPVIQARQEACVRRTTAVRRSPVDNSAGKASLPTCRPVPVVSTRGIAAKSWNQFSVLARNESND